MKITTNTVLASMTAFSLGLTLLYASESCPDKGIVQGNKMCSTATECMNLNSQATCTTAVTIAAFPLTGTVNDSYIDQISVICTTPVNCVWKKQAGTDVYKCEVGATVPGGTTGNALKDFADQCSD